MRIASVLNHLCAILPLVGARISIPEVRKENKNHDLRNLKAADLGYWHNKIIMQVHDRIKDEMPADSEEYEKIMAEEISTLCPIDDYECKSSVQEYMDKNRERVPKFMEQGHSYQLHRDFPKGFDSEVQNHLTNIYYSVYLLEHNDLEDVIKTITVINEDAQKSDLSESNKAIIESIASIARGSSELWTDAHKNPENAFHQLHKNNKRKLQEEGKMVLLSIVTSPVQFVLADVWGAIRAAIIPSVMMIFQMTNIISMITGILRSAATDSLYAAGIYVPSKFDYAKCIFFKVTDLKECNRTTLFGPYFDGTKLPGERPGDEQNADEDP